MKNIFTSILLLFTCVLTTRAQIITTIIGNGTIGYSGSNGPATAAQIRGATGIVKDAAGNIYISEGPTNVVRKISPSGIITLFAGTGTLGTHFSGDGGPATDAQIANPDGLAIDKAGNIYIADALNFRVRKVDASGIITTYAGDGTNTYTGDGGSATAAGLGGGAISICFDAADNLYISVTNRIRKVTPAGIISTYGGNGTISYTGDGGPATAAGMSQTVQIAMDTKGYLYMASTASVRKISPSGIITTVAGNNTVGYSGDGVAATAALVNSTGIFADKCGNVYLGDRGNNRIRVIDGHGVIKDFCGTGAAGYSGDGGSAKTAKLNGPSILYLDDNSNIYFSDDKNYVVRYIKMDSCHSVLGVNNETTAATGLQVYPNPNNGTFTLKVATPVTVDASIIVTDVMGRTVLQLATATNKETELSLRVPQGIYFIQVAAAGEHYAQRIVVQ